MIKKDNIEKIQQQCTTLRNAVSDGAKVLLEAGIEKSGFVTKEEFEIQKKMLLKTRERLDSLEKVIDQIITKSSDE